MAFFSRSLNPYQYHHGVDIRITAPQGSHHFDTVFTARHLRLHRRKKKIEIYIDANRLGLNIAPRKKDGLGFCWHAVPAKAEQEIQQKIDRNELVKVHIERELFVT